MGVRDLLVRNLRRARRGEVRELVFEGGYELYSGAWRLGKLLPLAGTNVYDREWDLLVVLDGCRVDALRTVGEEYPFVGPVESIRSVGSMSVEWLTRTFGDADPGAVAGTAYVTANIFSRGACDPGDFRLLDEVWRDTWDGEYNTVPARPVTDRAIDAARRHDPDRTIVHYMQPHHPFVGESDLGGQYTPDPFGRDNDGEGAARTVWDALRRGEVERAAVERAYRENLRYVLDEVAVLVENVDAERAVLTADHGNAIGEWGIYGHPIGFPHPSVRRVPWAETTATDERTRIPEVERGGEVGDVEERLAALGYR